MKILAAACPFKGSLTFLEAGEAIRKGVQPVDGISALEALFTQNGCMEIIIAR